MAIIPVVDLYQCLANSNDEYRQKGSVFIHPFRLVINGSSGCGRTNLACNIILDHCEFDTLTIFAKYPNQPLFKLVIDTISQSCPDITIHVSDNIDKEINEENFDPQLQHLVIIDGVDLSDEVNDFFKHSRLSNISVVLICQNLDECSSTIYENSNYGISFKCKDIDKFRRCYCPNLDDDIFNTLYYGAIEKITHDDKDAFILCSVDEQNDLGKKFRKGFTPYTLIDQDGNLILSNPNVLTPIQSKGHRQRLMTILFT